MTLKEIIDKLSDRNITVVAHRADVGYRTLINIANGTNTNPTLSVFNKIVDYLEANK